MRGRVRGGMRGGGRGGGQAGRGCGVWHLLEAVGAAATIPSHNTVTPPWHTSLRPLMQMFIVRKERKVRTAGYCSVVKSQARISRYLHNRWASSWEGA